MRFSLRIEQPHEFGQKIRATQTMESRYRFCRFEIKKNGYLCDTERRKQAMQLRRMLKFVLVVMAFFAAPILVFGEGDSVLLNGRAPSDSVVEGAEGKSAFSPTDLIFGHVSDAYDWHIFTLGSAHVALPLPVILYSRLRGTFHLFFSSRFHTASGEYEGFRLVLPEGGGKPVVVECDTQGGVLADAPRPLDFSITKNVVSVIFVCALMLWLFISIARRYSTERPKAPHGMQGLLEPLILFVRDDIAVPSIGKARAGRFMPFLLTLFFFILLSNLLGLIPFFPGGANVTGNITVTMVLALFTFIVTTISGNRHYWKDIVDTPGVPVFLKLPVPIMPVVELAGMFTKPIVLMIRLFANMLAGHMISLVFFSLIFLFGALNSTAGYAISPVSVIFGVFMTLLDVLVSFIQAYVFTLLSAIYFGMAVEMPGAELKRVESKEE